MTRSATNSNDTVSTTNTKTSCGPSDLAGLERDLPTTAEDVRVQRELRQQPGKNLLPYIDELLNPRDLGQVAPRDTTFEGWEPFELD